MLIKDKLGNIPGMCVDFFFWALRVGLGWDFSGDALTEVAKISMLHFFFSISNLEADYIQNTPSSKTRLGIPVLGLKKQECKKMER